MTKMDWLKAFRENHTSGYVRAGRCLSCRRGEHGCIGGRYRNECPNYLDNNPTREEYLQRYSELLERLFAAEGEPARGDLYGAAQRRRKFLRFALIIKEEQIRAVEDMSYRETEQNRRDLRRLRWEL